MVSRWTLRDIKTEGISKITKEDMEYAKALNASIKLIGESKRRME